MGIKNIFRKIDFLEYSHEKEQNSKDNKMNNNISIIKKEIREFLAILINLRIKCNSIEV